MVRTPRGESAQADVGEFCPLGVGRNLVLEKHVDLEAMFLKYGALRAGECWDRAAG
jgi:hypothetical protein